MCIFREMEVPKKQMYLVKFIYCEKLCRLQGESTISSFNYTWPTPQVVTAFNKSTKVLTSTLTQRGTSQAERPSHCYYQDCPAHQEDGGR